MKTSVIIPTYYRSDELFRLLKNLLEQLVKPEEVLVIDDTPTNEIRNVCEKYAVEFNKVGIALLYVKNPGERSISVARNLGAKMAKGEYFLFIDSDVTLYPDYVEKILDTFKKYPEVLGVGGWDKQFMYHQIPSGIRYHSKQVFNKLFLNWHFSIDSCKNFEVPSILSRTVYCEYINGQSISVKSSVLNEFQFDENLNKYSWMDDWLFTHSIYRRYPKSLLTTPDVMYTHSASLEGKPAGKELGDVKMRNRKYVHMKLFGFRGLVMFGWQNLGILIIGIAKGIMKKKSAS